MNEKCMLPYIPSREIVFTGSNCIVDILIVFFFFFFFFLFLPLPGLYAVDDILPLSLLLK